MSDSYRMPHMVEPTDPKERAAAIRICRANAHRDINTGHRVTSEEGRAQWNALRDTLPYAKWLWMWNNGREEWDNTTARSDASAEQKNPGWGDYEPVRK